MMRHLFRRDHQNRSGYIALAAFVLTYLAALAFVVAPGRIAAALDSLSGWLF
jgi:hypothetical protein